MSVFLVSALNSLGMGATLVALSVVALDAWSRGGLLGKAHAPLVHAGAALLVSEGGGACVCWGGGRTVGWSGEMGRRGVISKGRRHAGKAPLHAYMQGQRCDLEFSKERGR